VNGSRPPLVIVSGAPGTGKTTLAATLAERLLLPLIARDDLKERLADVVLPRTIEEADPVGLSASNALGRASYAMLFLVADRLVQAGAGAIIESNFRRGLAEPELANLVGRAAAVLIHCRATPQLVLERVRTRAGSVARHRVHPDLDRLADLQRELADGTFEPLELGIETIRVDTTNGYAPSLDELLARIKSAIG
jgi:predicted kinase